jgi:hypothetical protein
VLHRQLKSGRYSRSLWRTELVMGASNAVSAARNYAAPTRPIRGGQVPKSGQGTTLRSRPVPTPVETPRTRLATGDEMPSPVDPTDAFKANIRAQ